jgi:hypothetical protein
MTKAEESDEDAENNNIASSDDAMRRKQSRHGTKARQAATSRTRQHRRTVVTTTPDTDKRQKKKKKNEKFSSACLFNWDSLLCWGERRRQRRLQHVKKRANTELGRRRLASTAAVRMTILHSALRVVVDFVGLEHQQQVGVARSRRQRAAAAQHQRLKVRRRKAVLCAQRQHGRIAPHATLGQRIGESVASRKSAPAAARSPETTA